MTDQQKSLRRSAAGLRRRLFLPRSVKAQLDSQAKQLEKLNAAMTALKAEWKPVHAVARYGAVEHGWLMNQVGVLEERLGSLEERLGSGTFVADDQQMAEARDLVQAVRQEHQQVRVRMQIISHYEERLRRVEDAMAQLYEGDPRHVV
jgi:hypothetical protein